MAYPGGKSGPGVYHRLINLMPPHAVYCEPFLGAGAIMRRKLPAPYNIGVDMDAGVIADWRSRIGEAACIGSRAASGSARGNADSAGGIGEAAERIRVANPPTLDTAGGNGDGRSTRDLVGKVSLPISAAPGESADRRRRRSVDLPILDPARARAVDSPILDPKTLELATANPPSGAAPKFRFLRGDALTFLQSYPFTAADLVYCDPPYLPETLSSRCRYRHNLTTEQHGELLSTILELPCRVMLSGYWSKLYTSSLHRWNSIHFEAMTRGGMATEWLWFNFEPPVVLHDYRYLGESAHQRQDLKRMVASWTGKLERMPPLKKQALLAAIASVG